jgi:hypothetical protein
MIDFNSNNMIEKLFKSIDKQDTQAFQGHLTDDVKFRFGNAPVVEGKNAVGETVSGFFSSVKAIQHELTEFWQQQGVIICHGNVTYTRHDSTTLTIPFANILTLENDLIKDYLIFADTSKLYAET